MPTAIPMSPLAFLNLLHAGSEIPSGQIEFRFLPPRKDDNRDWMPYPINEGDPHVWTPQKARKGRQAYFGISIRKQAGEWEGVGGNDNCHATHLLWVDVDVKNTHYLPEETRKDPRKCTKEEIRAAAESLYADLLILCDTHGLRDLRAVVYSGGGVQFYWARTVTTTKEDTEHYNRVLNGIFKGDNVADPARIFRVPGTLHTKNPQRPIEVEVWLADPEATISEETLKALPEPEPEKKAIPETPLNAPASTLSVPAGPASSESVISQFNSKHTIYELLERYGYTRESRDRYTRPGEGASGNDVHILPCGHKGFLGSHHFSSNDPMQSDEVHDPFALYCFYEHGGDTKKAVAAAAMELGIAHKQVRKEKAQKPPKTNSPKGDQPESPKTEPPAPSDEKLTLTQYRDRFLDWCKDQGHIYKYHQKRRSWYEYHQGVYREVLDEVMLQRADKAFQSMGFNNLKTANLKEVLDKVSREYHIAAVEEDLKFTELNVQNGILDLQTCTLRPHDPTFFSTIQSAATYRPDIKAHEWDTFLREAIPSQKDRLILQMFAGLCLTSVTEPQKALFLIGEGGTGKGTYVSVLQEVLGGLATSSALENIKDGSFLVGNLVSKRMCIVDEIARHIDWLPFKRVTGEASITIDVKNKTPYTERLTIKLIVLSNVLPLLGEDASNTSLTRRMLIVPFNVKPKESDPTLKKRLTHPRELSGVLNWMIEGWKLLQENNLRFPEPESDHIQKEITARSNHVIFYVEERLQRGGWIAAGELYKDYQSWAMDNGYRVMPNNKFASEMFPAALKELGFEGVERQKTNSKNIWNGVQIKAL